LGSTDDVSLGTIQTMMRHAKATTTGVYIHRVNKSHLAAQEKFLTALQTAKNTQTMGTIMGTSDKEGGEKSDVTN
jgi:hypothetical protein